MQIVENIPVEENNQIAEIIRLTLEQLNKRYPGGMIARRGQHAKDHGCLTATFKVNDDLPNEHRIGVFAEAGRDYDSWVRFSNADAVVGADSPTKDGKTAHGSRGMAIKLMAVAGTPLLPLHGALTQDFLMVNHPVFPFANVEDYLAVTRAILEDGKPDRFFAERIHMKAGKPDTSDPATVRTLRTGRIVSRIRSLSLTGDPPAFQAPPPTPADNQYFGGAPFLFGGEMVMRYRVTPRTPLTGDVPNLSDPGYLRKNLHQRLTAPGAQDIVFDFQAQIREMKELSGNIDTEIEDATLSWDEATHPFHYLATLTISPQDFEGPERRQVCESLVFTPWHGITGHRPLGGINRLRRAVYEASAAFRHLPKEPSGRVRE